MSKKIYIGDTEIAGGDGKSAYQSWLDQGNTGTEAEFLASLKGASGIYPVIEQTASSVQIQPNVLNLWGEMSSLAITFATPSDSNVVNEYMIQFSSPSASATTISLPSNVVWAESCGVLSVEVGKTYQISIVNNIGLWAAISNS